MRVVREVGEGKKGEACPQEKLAFSFSPLPLFPFSPPQKSMLEAHIACSSLKSEIISPLLILLLSPFASDNDDVGDLCQNGGSRCEYREGGEGKDTWGCGGEARILCPSQLSPHIALCSFLRYSFPLPPRPKVTADGFSSGSKACWGSLCST